MTHNNTKDGLPAYLTLESLDRTVQIAIVEDVGGSDSSRGSNIRGDITTGWTVEESAKGRGRLTFKERGILAGKTVAARVFWLIDPAVSIDWMYKDGDEVPEDTCVAYISGPLRSILTGERTMLNFLQRMSGIATTTLAFVRALESTGTKLLDTRKTAPGLRLLDKWAVKTGGGVNHRIGLFDEVMIKENHIVAAGGLKPALERVHAGMRMTQQKKVVVEVTTPDQIREILSVGGVDRILLDNMVQIRKNASPDVSRLQEAVDLIAGRTSTEASGNITLDAARVVANTGVNYISVGALTHSVAALDISLVIGPVNSA